MSQLNDQKVRRVLECLRDYRRRSIEEITIMYNQLYPPPLIGKYIGFKTDVRVIKPIIHFLEESGFIEKHIMSFTDEVHHVPLIQYSLTNGGIQHLSSLK